MSRIGRRLAGTRPTRPGTGQGQDPTPAPGRSHRADRDHLRAARQPRCQGAHGPSGDPHRTGHPPGPPPPRPHAPGCRDHRHPGQRAPSAGRRDGPPAPRPAGSDFSAPPTSCWRWRPSAASGKRDMGNSQVGGRGFNFARHARYAFARARAAAMAAWMAAKRVSA